MVWPWVVLFAVVVLGGLAVLVHVGLRVWRSARGLLTELDVAAVRAGELAELLARVQAVGATDVTDRTASAPGSEPPADDAWPGTVESYHHAGADAPGKKEP